MARPHDPTDSSDDEGAPKGSKLAPGDIVAERYRIQSRLGSGAMGAVYRAADEELIESVALKVLHQSTVKPRRFEREVEILRELNHPGIVRYLSHGQTATGAPFLVTELLVGSTLLDRMRGEPLPVRDVVAMARRVAEALTLAHERGIVHRDIKPDNLFLVGGRLEDVKVLDFGVARPVMDPDGPTQTGSVVGTPGYMAPEQVRGNRDVDARADVFGLGCVLYECLGGEPAFYANDLLALLSRILFDVPRPIRELRRDLAPDLDALVTRMLAKEREHRPSSQEVAATLARLHEEGVVVQRRAGGDEPPPASLPALTERELRLISVIVAARALAGAGADGEAISREPRERRGEAEGRAENLEDERTTTTGPLADADDPRVISLREVLDPFGAQVEALVDGSVVVTLPGKSESFGPQGHGSATDRAAVAARCALAMRRALPDAPMSLATGLGEVSGRLPIGDAIDRAALLARAAARGFAGGGDRPDLAREQPIRVDPVTAGLLDGRFVVSELGTGFCLVGVRDQPVGRRTTLGDATPFVGRDVELGALVAAYDRAVHGNAASLAIVVGAPGSGKSRLAAELVLRLLARSSRERSDPAKVEARPPEIWSGRADPVRSGQPLGMLSQLVRSALGIADSESLFIRQTKIASFVERYVAREESADVTAFISELAGAPLAEAHHEQLAALRRDPERLRAKLLEAFCDVVRARARRRPLVLSVDDLQWADAASIDAIEYLVAQVEDRPLFVLAIGRTEMIAAASRMLDAGEIVQLGPLSDDHVRVVARTVLGEAADPAAVEWVVSQGQGMPLLVEELVRSAAEGRIGRLPVTVVAVARARLDALGGEDRRVLRAASVLGVAFRMPEVRALLGGIDGCPDLDARLEELSRLELLRSDGSGSDARWTFRDAAVREAAYDSLTDGDRTLGHRLAAEMLEADTSTDPLLLARHLERAGEPGRAARAYAQAAEGAFGRGDVAAAIAHAERAVDCGATGEVLGSMRLLQAEGYAWQGKLERVVTCAEEAAAAMPRGTPRHFLATTRVAIAKSRIGDGGGLRAAATSVEQALGRSDPDRAIFIAAIELAIHLGDIGRADRALQIAERIEQMAPRLSPGTPFLDARLAALRATVARHVGHPDSALVALGRSIELFEEARDARRACEQRARLGATFAELGAHDRAEAVLGFTSREVDRHRIVGVVPATRLAMAAALSLRRAHGEARAQAEAALAAAREQKDRAVEASAGAALSLILKDLGDAGSAESAARAALEIAPAPPERAHALGALASSLVARHLYREAAEASREGVEILEAAAGHVAAESVVRLAHAVATAATGKRAAALDQLKLARERLLSRAAALTDPDDRRRFLEGVPENARTLELARASLGE